MLRASLRLRSVIFCVTTLVLFLVVVVGCGVNGGGGGGSDQQEEGSDVSQQEEEQKGASPVAGSFVGEVPDASAFIAIVADVPEGGRGRARG